MRPTNFQPRVIKCIFKIKSQNYTKNAKFPLRNSLSHVWPHVPLPFLQPNYELRLKITYTYRK